jgi:hypothetical protein
VVFYTYLWLREDGTPYYVGKGKDDRAFKRASHIQTPPSDIQRIIIQEFESEIDAFAAEIFLISYYGRKDLGTGVLRNRTDGGEGQSGRITSEATRQKLRVNGIRMNNEGYLDRMRSREASIKGGRKTAALGHLKKVCVKGGASVPLAVRRKNGAIAGKIAKETGRIHTIATPESLVKGGRAAMKIINHNRWHRDRRIVNPKCELCSLVITPLST